jgi:ABC-type uncharacterized transport system involved in gliding motility auxiliary subunit
MTDNIQLPNGDFLTNYPEVTRVEVVTNYGCELVLYECSNVQVSLQDDGRTIKVFLKKEQISEEENERRLKECMKWINNLKLWESGEMMDVAMSNLSPAAQAVLDAVDQVPRVLNCTQDHPLFAAAALRAAADEVISSVSPPCEDFNEYDRGFLAAHIKYRDEFLAIADELEAQ